MKGPVTARTIGILIFFFFSPLLYAQDYKGDHHFHTMDADRNGRLSHAEFYRGMDEIMLFESWDNNQDGVLDRQEVYDNLQEQSAFPVKRARQQFSPGERVQLVAFAPEQEDEAGKLLQLNYFLRLADLNRNNRLNKTEFYLFLFRQFDADENGSLLPGEYVPESL